MLSRTLVIFALLVTLGCCVSSAWSQSQTPRDSTPSAASTQADQPGGKEAATQPANGEVRDSKTPPEQEKPVLGVALLRSLQTTFDKTTWVGWAILFLGILGGLVVGRIVQTVLNRVGQKLEKHGWAARGSLFRYAAGPANLTLIGIGLGMGLHAGPVLEPEVRTLAMQSAALISVIALAWFLFNVVDLVEIALRRITHDDTIIQLIRKALRIFLLVVFGLFIAQNFFGANITAWLAGLGLAGLAVSLAAQGPIKNIFGSVTIVLDRPFGIGDAIKYGGYTGTVEAMGFRSTKLRTVEGHLVTIPNSKLIDDMVENISIRTSIRRVLNITIAYDTPPEKIELALELVRAIFAESFMAETFDLDAAPPQIFFTDFNPESLNLQAIYWYQLNQPNRGHQGYLIQAQEFNMRLFRAFADAGIEFAFPTRTLFLAGDPNRRLAVSVEQSNGSIAHDRTKQHSAIKQ